MAPRSWGQTTAAQLAEPSTPEQTDLFISGVYPHLTTYGIYSQNGGHFRTGHNECGIGAVVPWAGKLWMVNYAPHMPRGSEHKLFSVDSDLSKPITIHPESVGGTPAGRMIHAESKQLLIAHYAISDQGVVRAIQPEDMPIRVTAIARHLLDPANMVYYVDMEGSIWEANVHTLAVKRLFKKPVPGWHGKGGYTSQGRLIVSNNGELHVGNYADLLVGGEAKSEAERGVLAEWNGDRWSIIERRQFTEVTGPLGITGGSDGDDPVWAIGWDEKSLRLKLLEEGRWYTYLLPKAAYCNDASHGWYTEWPRIREITGGRWMMDMHGMFFDFPKTFSTKNSKGLKPIGSHLRYVPDFCDWNGRLVLATDETSIQGNPLAGQPQSNLWFGDYEDLKTWGPADAYGGPWLHDQVKKGTPSDPFFVAGFQKRVLFLSLKSKADNSEEIRRTSDQQSINEMPTSLKDLTRISVKRGDWHQPSPGFSFKVNQPVTVYLAVDQRGEPELPTPWQLTDMTIRWGNKYQDLVYKAAFPAGTIFIPRNETEHLAGSFGMPHLALIENNNNAAALQIDAADAITITRTSNPISSNYPAEPVTFKVQLDREGNGIWQDYTSLKVQPGGSSWTILPESLSAAWLRLVPSEDCVATAFMHQTGEERERDSTESEVLFDGLADVESTEAIGARVYAAKRNRNLRMITNDDRYFDFTKATFEFEQTDHNVELDQLLHIDPEFSIDKASIIITHGQQKLRLPKGHTRYDTPFAGGWPRAVREVESERLLANIHGTFYEVPLVTNGAPPAWNLMRPVASHQKQITDYCSWNGLLVLAGVDENASSSEHVFINRERNAALWFGGIDDLWKLGEPRGVGGPWLESKVNAGQKSDPYLMTGYGRKVAELSHASAEPITFTVEVDITGKGDWIEYSRLNVPANETIRHEFPDGFSAMWLRASVNRATTANLQLYYGS